MKTIQCTYLPHHHNGLQAMLQHVFMMSLYIYYALCFVHFEHSVCLEPISALINIFMLLA